MKKQMIFFCAGILFCDPTLSKAEETPPETAPETVKTEAPAVAKPRKVRKKVRAKKVLKSQNAAPQAPVSSAKLEDVQQASRVHKSQSFQAWLKDLKMRVNHSQTQQNQLVAVAAVRGAETPDAPPLYWKGKQAEARVEVPELKDFEAALDTAITGEPGAAKEELQSFILAYPKSSLVGDAKETLARLETSGANP